MLGACPTELVVKFVKSQQAAASCWVRRKSKLLYSDGWWIGPQGAPQDAHRWSESLDMAPSCTAKWWWPFMELQSIIFSNGNSVHPVSSRPPFALLVWTNGKLGQHSNPLSSRTWHIRTLAVHWEVLQRTASSKLPQRRSTLLNSAVALLA